MGFSLNELVQSSKYKIFMKYLYGWGASIVLAGSLFKLMHWAGAGVMLTVGMLTEAIIFFFSAFEPMVEEVDWSLVYPELAGITDDVGRERGGAGIDPGVLESVITSALSKSSLNIGSVSSAVTSGVPSSDAVNPVVSPVASSTSQPVSRGAGSNASGTVPQNQPIAPVAAAKGGMVFTEKFNEMLEKAEVTPELFTKVRVGLDRLSEASNGIARISDAVKSTESFTKNMQRAGGAIGKFAETYEESGALVSRTAQVLSQSFEGTATSIDNTGKSFAKGIEDIVAKMNADLTRASDAVGKGVTAAGTNLTELSKNIEALNAAHELQIKSVQSRMKETDALSAGVEDLMKKLSKTVDDSQKYSQSVAKLTDNVSQLNTIYGNMLSAMGSMLGK